MSFSVFTATLTHLCSLAGGLSVFPSAVLPVCMAVCLWVFHCWVQDHPTGSVFVSVCLWLMQCMVQGASTGPAAKAVRQNSQPGHPSDPPVAPTPPEAPPNKRPSPSSSTGSSELRRSALNTHPSSVNGWDTDPHGAHANADSAVDQTEGPIPAVTSAGHQQDTDHVMQNQQPPINAWHNRRGTQNASPALQHAERAQHAQRGSQQDPDPSLQPTHDSDHTMAPTAQPPQPSLQAQQRVKPYSSQKMRPQAAPYRPDTAAYNPPASSAMPDTAEYKPPSSSSLPDSAEQSLSPSLYMPPSDAQTADARAADTDIAEGNADNAWWDNVSMEDSNPTAAPADAPVLATPTDPPFTDLGGLSDPTPGENKPPLLQASGDATAEEGQMQHLSERPDQTPGHSQEAAPASAAGVQQSNQASERADEEGEELGGGREDEEWAEGRGEAEAPAGPSDAHGHRQEGDAEEEDRREGGDVHMLGTTPPTTSGIQPMAAAISQLTANQQVDTL